MSHSEKATSLCFLENHLTVRLDYEDIIRLESKQKSAKKNGRMYESFRKSYIIMLSRKLLSCEIWLWRHKLIRIQNQLKKNSFLIECMSRPKNALSSCYLENIDFWDSIMKIKVVLNWKKKLDKVYYMCDSFRKSKIIMLSRKLLIFETWLWRQKSFVIKKQLQNFLSSSQYVWDIQKKLPQFAVMQTLDFWDLVIKTKFVWN